MVLASWILAVTLPMVQPVETPRFGSPVLVAQIHDEDIDEASGLAVSGVHDDHYWLINDSGDDPIVYLVNKRGRTVSRLRVSGVENHDWEALDAFEFEGVHWLMIADVGDNDGLRPEIQLIFIREPTELTPWASVKPERITRVQLPGGATDVESAAVDPESGQVLLLAKRRFPATLWAVPWRIDGGVHAVFQADIDSIPQPTGDDVAEDPTNGRYGSQATDMAIAPDRRSLAILTMNNAWLYHRSGTESWAQTLERKPFRVTLPPLVQAEGFGFTPDGKNLVITSEKFPAPIVSIAIH